MTDKLDITLNSKTTEKLWSVDKTISSEKDLTEFINWLKDSQNKEEKKLYESLHRDLKDVETNTALHTAVKKTLEEKIVFKDAWKDKTYWIEIPIDGWVYNLHIQESILNNVFSTIAVSQESTVRTQELEKVKEEKLKEKKEWEQLTTAEIKELKGEIDKKFNIDENKITFKRDTVNGVAAIDPLDSYVVDWVEDPMWAIDYYLKKFEKVATSRAKVFTWFKWDKKTWEKWLWDRIANIFGTFKVTEAPVPTSWKETLVEKWKELIDATLS